MFGSTKLRGSVSTREGIFVTGYKTKFAVDPGLQDVIVPIACAQVSALATRPCAAVYVDWSNRFSQPALPSSLQALIEGGSRRGALMPYNPALIEY